MQIIVAAKNPEMLTDYLSGAGHEVKALYVNDLCLQMAETYKADVIVYLEDVEAVVPHEDALRQITGAGYRTVVVAKKDSKILVYSAGLGVKDFIFLPTDQNTILHRVENPATQDETAEMFRKLTSGDLLKQGTKSKAKEVKEVKKNSGKKTKKFFLDSFKPKTTAIVDGKTIKGNWDTPIDVLNDIGVCDGIIIPKSTKSIAIKEYRRDKRSKFVPLVVLKGNKEHLAAGADRSARKITPELIQEISSMAKRLTELWTSVETDALTGVYTRKFFNAWLKEQEEQKNPFSLVIIDLDKFKAVNDTYGHPGGDAVLATFGNFLRTETRANDFTARYGGEEFVIALPNTGVNEAYILIDRLREKWSKRLITTPDGQTLKSTFSAGVAEWYEGCNVVDLADKMLYEAKEGGRNQVKAEKPVKNIILILGKVPTTAIKNKKIEITYDPQDATAVVSDRASIKYAPDNIPLYVLGTGSVSDWMVKRERPDSILCQTMEEIVCKITGEEQEKTKKTEETKTTKLAVLPGTRSDNRNQTIPQNGALYVVCPSRPALAGEMAAKICNSVNQSVALVCAVPESTGALAMGIPKEDLITSDWRIPGAKAPLLWTEVTIWPVDPYKFINPSTASEVHRLVDQIKPKFSLVVVDCGGSLDICSRVAKDEGVLVLHKEGDSSDTAASYWIKNYGGHSVMVMAPSEVPQVIEAENGYVVRQTAIDYSQLKV